MYTMVIRFLLYVVSFCRFFRFQEIQFWIEETPKNPNKNQNEKSPSPTVQLWNLREKKWEQTWTVGLVWDRYLQRTLYRVKTLCWFIVALKGKSQSFVTQYTVSSTTLQPEDGSSFRDKPITDLYILYIRF